MTGRNHVTLIEKPRTGEHVSLNDRLLVNSDTVAAVALACQLISAAEMAEIKQKAKLLGIGIDQLLLSASYVPRSLRQVCCQAGQYVEQGISVEAVAAALSISIEFGQPLEKVLARFMRLVQTAA